MPRYHTSLVIEAQPTAIGERIRNIEEWDEWFPGIVEAHPDENVPEVGSMARIDYIIAGKDAYFTILLQASNPQERVAYNLTDGTLRGELAFTLAPVEGGTEVTVETDYTIAGEILAAAPEAAAAQAEFEANLYEALNNLREALT